MNPCIICATPHDRVWFGSSEPHLYCEACEALREQSIGKLTEVWEERGWKLYLSDESAAPSFQGERLCVYDTPPTYPPPWMHVPIMRKRPGKAWDRRDGAASWQKLDEASALIESMVCGGEKLLVHCRGGIERSPLTIVWWLVKTGRYSTMREAYAYLKGLRPVIADRTHWL